MATPGWATELEEEWLETSPSPPPAVIALPAPESPPPINPASIRAKRGSLRALGHAAARALPPSRSFSLDANSHNIHREGGRVRSERSDNLPPSPPSSDEGAAPAGTFVVKEGVEDDRGKALAKVKKGRDMFGPTALEKMFQPPSPDQQPQAPSHQAQQPTSQQSHSKQPHADEPRIKPQATAPTMDARRASHPYAPANPSRLSKSVTPSTASSITMSEMPTGLAEGLSVTREEEAEPDLPRQEFSFTYPAPAPESHSTVFDRPPPSGVRLFRSTWNTATREHLSNILDSIALEPSPSPPSAPNAQNLQGWSPDASSSESSDMRSSKRMRMSPVSPAKRESGTEGGGTIDWGAQGRAMLERIRRRPVESTTSGSVSVSDKRDETRKEEDDGTSSIMLDLGIDVNKGMGRPSNIPQVQNLRLWRMTCPILTCPMCGGRTAPTHPPPPPHICATLRSSWRRYAHGQCPSRPHRSPVAADTSLQRQMRAIGREQEKGEVELGRVRGGYLGD